MKLRSYETMPSDAKAALTILRSPRGYLFEQPAEVRAINWLVYYELCHRTNEPRPHQWRHIVGGRSVLDYIEAPLTDKKEKER